MGKFLMAIQNDDAQRVLASLPLQMLVYFNMWFVALYFVASLLLFIYKGFTFPYPESALAWEVTMLFLYAFVEAARLFLGKHPLARPRCHVPRTIGWSDRAAPAHAIAARRPARCSRLQLPVNS